MLPVSVLKTWPVPDPARVEALLDDEIRKNRVKLIVLDDDPTGTQSVHDVPVYTRWDEEAMEEALRDPRSLFYVLTNTRAMSAAEAERVLREIGASVAAAAAKTGAEYLFLSRSDSTLRGHYPLETEVLKSVVETDDYRIDGEVLCFFFKDGGRFTIDNVHYVKQGDVLVPAAETEFAKDPAFGYTHSDLPGYVEEKTGGRYPAEGVQCVPLEVLRAVDVDAVEAQLMALHDFGKIAVNAVDYCDVKVFAAALLRAMNKGKHFCIRTAADLVRVLGGIKDRPLLTREEIVPEGCKEGGLIVVGSYMQRTTDQLNALLTLPGLVEVPFDSDQVLDGPAALAAEVDRCVAEEEKAIRAGKTVVCYTKRTFLKASGTPEEVLARQVQISDAVQSLVGKLSVKPRFLISKGGITSADIAVKALGIRKAEVLGQVKPSIPVWLTGEGSKYPGLPYIIFPGNTGEVTTLREMAELLR